MRKRFHGLKKPKPRQDWSKWNLYNVSRMTVPFAATKTFFQQKWMAKSLTRAYHGEVIREGQWTRMFDRRLPAVVHMDYRVLARSDGSSQAAGRGSGLHVVEENKDDDNGRRKNKTPPKTPYMHMTYHPTERRLDTAVWRALFASSTRQARQFVVHGSVKVNGKKMIYPGYLLNPGDMFSVDPERVLYATGARKYRKNSPETLQDAPRNESNEQTTTIDDDAEDALEETAEESPEKSDDKAEAATSTSTATSAATEEDPKDALKLLFNRAKTILSDSKKDLSGRRQQELRAFSQSVKKTLSRIRGTRLKTSTPLEETIDGLEETLSSITAKIPSSPTTTTTTLPSPTTPQTTPSDANPAAPEKTDAYLARKNAELLHAALARAQANPIDVRKPYATPWRPREYMSAFAFIPRYLEVNQAICAAVYLRHPVARPGLAEVPTPFHGETMALAFNWYLRRR